MNHPTMQARLKDKIRHLSFRFDTDIKYDNYYNYNRISFSSKDDEIFFCFLFYDMKKPIDDQFCVCQLSYGDNIFSSKKYNYSELKSLLSDFLSDTSYFYFLGEKYKSFKYNSFCLSVGIIKKVFFDIEIEQNNNNTIINYLNQKEKSSFPEKLNSLYSKLNNENTCLNEKIDFIDDKINILQLEISKLEDEKNNLFKKNVSISNLNHEIASVSTLLDQHNSLSLDLLISFVQSNHFYDFNSSIVVSSVLDIKL